MNRGILSRILPAVIYLGGALALAGCSDSDNVEVSDKGSQYVLIGTSYTTATHWQPITESRAEGVLESDVPESIGVWAYNDAESAAVMDNVEMYYVEGEKIQQQPWYTGWGYDNKWAYASLKTWVPSTANKDVYYNFLAYAPYTATGDDGIALIEPSYDGMEELIWQHVPFIGAEDYIVATDIVNHRSNTLSEGYNSVQTIKMKHIMSRLRFCFKLGSDYSELRYIHLKSMEIEIPKNNLYTVSVNYNPDDLAVSKPEIKWTQEIDDDPNASQVSSMFPLDNDPEVEGYITLSKDKTEYQGLASCYVCPTQDLSAINIKVYYDVYDNTGQLLRQNDSATNDVWIGLGAENSGTTKTLGAGKYYNVRIAIQPSFLYVLSDSDPEADGGIVIK